MLIVVIKFYDLERYFAKPGILDHGTISITGCRCDAAPSIPG